MLRIYMQNRLIIYLSFHDAMKRTLKESLRGADERKSMGVSSSDESTESIHDQNFYAGGGHEW